MFNNPINSFGQLTASGNPSPCIFNKLATSGLGGDDSSDRPKPCSNEKSRPSGILCEEHLKVYFNVGIKQEIAKPSDNSTEMKFYSLKFTSTPDILIPFPMSLKSKKCTTVGDPPAATDIKSFEFCLDIDRIQTGFSGTQYLPSNVMATLLTNTNLSDLYLVNMISPQSINPGVAQSYGPILLAKSTFLDKYFDNVEIIALADGTEDKPYKGLVKNGQIKIPMNMLPTFYKFIFFHAGISNLKSNKDSTKNESFVLPPNVVLNLDSQAFEIFNKSSTNKIFTYSGLNGRETITTPVILLAEKSVPDIKKENSQFNASSLLNFVPVCHQ
jgi:hypothetical protein